MKIGKFVQAGRRLKNDPLGFLLDILILIVANLLIPIPLVGNFILEFRGFALGALGFLTVLVLFIFLSIGVVFATPLLIASGYLNSIFPQSVHASSQNDDNFADVSIPQQNPFGGSGLSYVTITAYFHDPNYYLTFGKIHTGIDMVPNDTYFQNSKTYKTTVKMVPLSSLSGTVDYYVDGDRGNTVVVTNSQNSLRALSLHLSQVFVSSGQTIKAGTPLGVMGHTGFATADHLHYEIQINDNGVWTPVDPLPYIQ